MAEALKEQGNLHFRSKEYDKAIECYTTAIEKLGAGDKAAKVTLLINRALCYSAKEEHGPVISDCTDALAIEPDNVKALFRRGSSFESLGRLDEALEDFKAIRTHKANFRPAADAVKRILKAKQDGGAAPAAGAGGARRGARLTKEDMLEIQELESRVKETTLELAQANERKRLAAQEARRVDLVQQELATGTTKGLYFAVGKMFISATQDEVTSSLQKRKDGAEERFRTMDKTAQLLEQRQKEAERNFLETIQRFQR